MSNKSSFDTRVVSLEILVFWTLNERTANYSSVNTSREAAIHANSDFDFISSCYSFLTYRQQQKKLSLHSFGWESSCSVKKRMACGQFGKCHNNPIQSQTVYSYRFIPRPIKQANTVSTILLLTSTRSSGRAQTRAPIFLAMEIAYLKTRERFLATQSPKLQREAVCHMSCGRGAYLAFSNLSSSERQPVFIRSQSIQFG